MWWLLREDRARQIAEAKKAGLEPSPDQRALFAERAQAARDSGKPRSLVIAGDVAEISIEGVLTKDPDIFMMWFGGGNTAYRDVIAALALAESDPAIKRVVLRVDSPGGNVDGLFDCLAALEAFSKPLSAVASEACSAAYAIASMAKTIEATNAAAMFGSIGVAASFWVWGDIVTVTSTEAPDKRPDVTTEEGKAVVRKHLDDIHGLFADVIARGRGTTLARVNSDFGRGATLLARDAQKRGMIDSIAPPARVRAVATPSTPDSAPPEKSTHSSLVQSLIAHSLTGAPAHETPGQAAKRLSALIGGASEEAPQQPPEQDLGDLVLLALAKQRGEDVGSLGGRK